MSIERELLKSSPDLREAADVYRIVADSKGAVEHLETVLGRSDKPTIRFSRGQLEVLKHILTNNANLSARLYEELRTMQEAPGVRRIKRKGGLK